MLLQPDFEFEHKYQRNVDELNEDQLRKVNAVFETILFNNWNKYKGQFVTYIELMSMHKSRFGIMENLNDLLCKGSKDYKESLATVQDFNATKIMSRICSVPSKNGDVTLNRIYFDMLKIILQDIQLFNHIFDIFNGGRGIFAEFEGDHEATARKKKVLKAARGAADPNDGEIDDDDNAKVTDQFMRDPHDVMSFYQTNMLCEAFTDVNKFCLSEAELRLEAKITELYA